MTKDELEAQIASLVQQEQHHRVLAERTVGARQVLEHLLKGMIEPAAVSAFPKAVQSVEDATGTS